MNKARFFLAAVALFVCGSMGAQKKATLNDVQKKAQQSLIEYLRTKHYSPTIDTQDQSVCFKKNDLLFWVTFEGNTAPLLYTIHREGIKFTTDKDGKEKVSRKREVAQMAANEVTARRTVKAFLSRGGRVEFCLPVYAATPEEFQNVFERSLAAFNDIKKTFDDYYKKSRNVIDSIHSYWYDLDTTSVVLEQKNVPGTVEAKNLKISGISVRVVNADGSVVSDYDKAIRRGQCRFLQEKVTLTSAKDGAFKIGVKLYNKDGKLFVPHKGTRFTTVTTIDVPKAGKVVEAELLKFGTDVEDYWKAGEYKIEFYEDDTLIYTDAINIL